MTLNNYHSLRTNVCVFSARNAIVPTSSSICHCFNDLMVQRRGHRLDKAARGRVFNINADELRFIIIVIDKCVLLRGLHYFFESVIK